MSKKKQTSAAKAKGCFCPYCEKEIAISALPICQYCHVTLRRCKSCLTVVPKEAKACPACGGELE